jgi:hypothetical protein
MGINGAPPPLPDTNLSAWPLSSPHSSIRYTGKRKAPSRSPTPDAARLAQAPSNVQQPGTFSTSDAWRAPLQRPWPQRDYPTTTGTPGGLRNPQAPVAIPIASLRSRASQAGRDGRGRPHKQPVNGSVAASGGGVPPPRPPRPTYVPPLDVFGSPTSAPSPASRNAPSPRSVYSDWEAEYQMPRRPPAPPTNNSCFNDPSPYPFPGSLPRPPPPPPSAVTTDPSYPQSTFARRSGTFAAPPIRKGSSAYYSQYSHVSPIPEETTDSQASHVSYASSRVIPRSWGSGLSEDMPSPPVNGYVLGANDGSSKAITGVAAVVTTAPGRPAAVALAAQGPLPSPTHSPTYGNGFGTYEDVGPLPESSQQWTPLRSRPDGLQQPPESLYFDPMHAAPEGLEAPDNSSAARPATVFPGTNFGTSLAPESAPTAANRLATHSPPASGSAGSHSPLLPPMDPVAQQVLQGLRKGTALENPRNPASNVFASNGAGQANGSSPRGLRRPPPIAKEEPATRASITSLPELIKRATRLASVLDRGRPTSRFELNIPSAQVEPERDEIPSRKEPCSRMVTAL